jgi:hypothetical protein
VVVNRSAGVRWGFVGGLFVAVWFTIRAVTGAGSLGGAWAVALTVIGIVGGIGLVLGGLILQARPSVLSYRALSELFPDGSVARIMAIPDFRYGFNRLRGVAPGSAVPKYVVMVAHNGSLAFWAPGATQPLLTLESGEIMHVEAKDESAGFSVRTRVFVTVLALNGAQVILPMRNTGLTAFSDTPAAVRLLAAGIGHQS